MEGYADPIIGKRRKGDSDSPFVDVSESLQVVNGKVVLSEIPNRFERVQVTLPGQTFYETEKEILNNTEFRVDYFNGVVFFNEMWNSKTPAFKYKGTGAHYFPYSRIWTQKGDALETLQDVMDNTEKGLEVIRTINQIKADNDVAKKNAETQTKYAKEQGDYAKAEGGKATTQANYAKQQGDYAKAEGDTAKSKGETAQQKADFANTQGNFAKQQGDYAKEQGDSAKQFVNDYVKKAGDSMTGNLKLPRLETTDQTPVIFNGNTNNRSWKWDMLGDNLSVTPTNTNAPGWDFSKTVTLQNLLKKTGDTVTGNFHVEVNDTPDKRIAWVNKDNLLWGFTTNADKSFQMYDWKNKKSVWAYDGNLFDMKAETNLLKKTGDTMTGTLNMDATTSERNLTWKTSVGDMGLRGKSDGVFSFRDWVKGIDVWSWDGTIFNVSTNTNLLKKTGDTITGGLIFKNTLDQQTTDGALGVVSVINPSLLKWAVGPRVNGNVDWSKELAMDLKTGKITVAEIVTKKDGQADLTLTADATNIDVANIPPVSYRRGNSITLKMAIRRNSSTNNVLTTLPTDMRPIAPLYQTITSTDSTPAILSIGTNGNVYIGDAIGTMSVQNKNYYIVITYVVD